MIINYDFFMMIYLQWRYVYLPLLLAADVDRVYPVSGWWYIVHRSLQAIVGFEQFNSAYFARSTYPLQF